MKHAKMVMIITIIYYMLLEISANAASGLKWSPVIVDEKSNVQSVIDFDDITAQPESGVIFFKTRICRITAGMKSSLPPQVKAGLVTFEGNCKNQLGRIMQNIEINYNGKSIQKEVKPDFENLYNDTKMSKLFTEACRAAGME